MCGYTCPCSMNQNNDGFGGGWWAIFIVIIIIFFLFWGFNPGYNNGGR